jgi:hypothetical protein
MDSKTNTAAALADSDKIQIWTYKTESRGSACGELGPVKTKTTERVDFERGIVESHTVGKCEGERVDHRHTYTIGAEATPERCAAYRRRNGYTRIG